MYQHFSKIQLFTKLLEVRKKWKYFNWLTFDPTAAGLCLNGKTV